MPAATLGFPDGADPKMPQLIDETLIWPSDDGQVRLRAARCEDCGHETYPPTAVCTACLSDRMTEFALEAPGNLYSFSIVHAAPKCWHTPYALGYVDFPGGLRALGHIMAPLETIEIGATVGLDIAAVGQQEDGTPIMTYVFVPR